MQKENQKTSHRDVMPSVAGFVSDLWFEEEFKEQPLYLQEIFELLLDTEHGNNLDLRQKNVELFKNQQVFSQNFISIYS